jgi:hypothetical protein
MITKPRSVNFRDSESIRCAVLGALGRSTKSIMAQTGLTGCQIGYRLHKLGVTRRDYRDGVSEVARRVERMALPVSEEFIREKIKERIGP